MLCSLWLKNNNKDKKIFYPEIINTKTSEKFLITPKTLVKDVKILGDNKYPAIAFGDGVDIYPLPDEPIPKNKIILRDKYDTSQNNGSDVGSLMIGGITKKDNVMFEESNLVYLMFVDLKDYRIFGLDYGISQKEVFNKFKEPKNIQNYQINEDTFLTGLEYSFFYDNAEYLLTLDFNNDKLYRIAVNIGNNVIHTTSDEEMKEYLEKKYGKDNVGNNEENSINDTYFVKDEDGNFVDKQGNVIESSNENNN